MATDNIFPDFTKSISRAEKENRLGQKGLVIWLTGLSGSGKTTLALALEKELFSQGRFAMILDGDNIRSGINNNLGFTADERKENIRRIAEVSKLFATAGIITIAAFISPTVEIRQMARGIIGNQDYFEVYISTPIEVCEERDVKGLYKKARRGEISDFTGISSPYDDPLNPDIIINTDGKPVDECIAKIIAQIQDRIK